MCYRSLWWRLCVVSCIFSDDKVLFSYDWCRYLPLPDCFVYNFYLGWGEGVLSFLFIVFSCSFLVSKWLFLHKVFKTLSVIILLSSSIFLFYFFPFDTIKLSNATNGKKCEGSDIIIEVVGGGVDAWCFFFPVCNKNAKATLQGFFLCC